MRALAALLAVAMAACSPAQAQSWAPVETYLLGPNGSVDWAGIAGAAPTFNWTLSQAADATVTPDTGAFTLTRKGSPTRVADGTYPAGLAGTQGYGYKFGTGIDYCADNANIASVKPAGSFSVVVVITPLALTTQSPIVGTWIQTGNARGWALAHGAPGDVSFWVSQNGSSICLNANKGGTPTPSGRRSFVAATYQYVAGGSSVSNIYVDGLSVGTASGSCGPVYSAGTQKFQVGGDGSSSNTCAGAAGNSYPGIIHHVAYFDGVVLTAAQVARLRAQWEGAQDAAMSPLTATVATPGALMVAAPGSGTTPFLVDTPVNTARVGAYGLYGAPAISNFVTYATLETGGGGGVGGHPLGWTTTETAGDGSAEVDLETSYAPHGTTSVKLHLHGTTSLGSIASNCITSGIGATVYGQVYAKKDSGGTSSSTLYLTGYANNDCTGASGSVDLRADGDLTTSWARYGGGVAATWSNTLCGGGACLSYKAVWEENCDGECTSYVDAVLVRQHTQPTDAGCFADTGTPPTCSVSNFAMAINPANAGDLEVQATVRSPIDGAVATSGVERYLFGTATLGANTFAAYWTNDTLTCAFIDSGGTSRSATVTAAGNADTAYRVVCQHAAQGLVRACWAGTCGNWSAAAATMTSAGTTFYVGGGGASTAREVWITDLQVFRSLVTP